MRCYLFFSDEEVFKGVVPPEEACTIPTEEANPQSTGENTLLVPLRRKLATGCSQGTSCREEVP